MIEQVSVFGVTLTLTVMGFILVLRFNRKTLNTQQLPVNYHLLVITEVSLRHNYCVAHLS